MDEMQAGEEYEAAKPIDTHYRRAYYPRDPWAHQPTCGKYCPYPDTSWVAPGASLPKCRGGDCTLCDENICTCLRGVPDAPKSGSGSSG